MKKIFISSTRKESSDHFVSALKKDLKDMGFEVLNVDKEESWLNIENQTTEHLISKSDIVIAIINETRPNVFFELGYATALGKQVLILSTSDFELPYNLKNFSNIKYDLNYLHSRNTCYDFIKHSKISEKRKVEKFTSLKELIKISKHDPQILHEISPFQFEKLVGDLFKKMGYDVSMTEQSKDSGIDLILTDRKNDSITLVECKKYNRNSKVSINTIREVLGTMSLHNIQKAIIITTSEFTSSAKELAKAMEKDIELWDYNFLCNKI